MSELVKVEINEGVAMLTLNNGKVNAFSHEMIADFNAALDQAEEAKAPVVIAGHPGMFSAGFDLKVMQKSMDAAMALVKEGSTLTRRLLSFPTPVIAACTGHAVAQGAFTLLCSDYRIGAAGEFKLGLNEVAIGMTMHHAGITMAKHGVTDRYLNRSLYLAEMFDPETAVEAGFLDEIVEFEKVVETAIEYAKATKKLNRHAHKGTKLKARAGLLEEMDRAIELDVNGSL
ncbi:MULTISPECIES: crotonase/enoyl-CoA hydratase family protein [unclassified Oleiphilus]|uniref:crotonase/enoyl-CoA hydratase family protein n=2 Tax=Oleiphilus TaxID=141450 RepID=UPI0007C2A55F|nr:MULTISPECIES: crotonase/enoyl-CoA hydratase family protein [unclassified Oleiphilus]KZY66680.1 enoyl-CoA hydratase [Oleiphilus sp. HI0066]KZY73123.1 enoyl-CoA hydratase [Oleiphilus sp. HI0067]